jgi:hypothetical protein
VKRICLAGLICTSTIACAQPGVSADPKAVTILIGENWIGQLEGLKITAQTELTDVQITAARINPDKGSIDVIAYPDARAGGTTDPDRAQITRFGLPGLSLLGTVSDVGAQNTISQPLLSVDSDISPPATAMALSADERLIDMNNGFALVERKRAGKIIVTVRDAALGTVIGYPHENRSAVLAGRVSPDGASAITYTRSTTQKGHWEGQARNMRTGQALPSAGLDIDDGATRELSQARHLACVLPGADGAIFTYIGQPADRYSEIVSFIQGTSKITRLDSPYVTQCLMR